MIPRFIKYLLVSKSSEKKLLTFFIARDVLITAQTLPCLFTVFRSPRNMFGDLMSLCLA